MAGEDGRYVIQRLLAGRYAVGIALKSGSDEAYPASFHPSAPTLQGATPVNIADGKSADRVDLVVHPNRKAVTIKVRVLGPDKRPVAMAMIRAEHPEDGTGYAGNAADPHSGFTDADGFTTIRLYAGTEYTLSATWQQLERKADGAVGRSLAWHHTNPVRLIAATEATVTLTLSENPEPLRFVDRGRRGLTRQNLLAVALGDGLVSHYLCGLRPNNGKAEFGWVKRLAPPIRSALRLLD